MKSSKENSKIIIAAVTEIAEHAKTDMDNNAVLAFVMADGEITVSVAGSPVELSKLVARAINSDKNVSKIIHSACDAAPLMAMFEGFKREDRGDADGDTCDCPACQLRRAMQDARKPSANPNVN